MGAVIDRSKCVACGRCVYICPGNIIRKGPDGIPYIRHPSDCWNCTSCMKECAGKAIYLALMPEMGGQGSKMTLRRNGHLTEWEILRPDDSRVFLATDTDAANKY